MLPSTSQAGSRSSAEKSTLVPTEPEPALGFRMAGKECSPHTLRELGRGEGVDEGDAGAAEGLVAGELVAGHADEVVGTDDEAAALGGDAVAQVGEGGKLGIGAGDEGVDGMFGQGGEDGVAVRGVIDMRDQTRLVTLVEADAPGAGVEAEADEEARRKGAGYGRPPGRLRPPRRLSLLSPRISYAIATEARPPPPVATTRARPRTHPHAIRRSPRAPLRGEGGSLHCPRTRGPARGQAAHGIYHSSGWVMQWREAGARGRSERRRGATATATDWNHRLTQMNADCRLRRKGYGPGTTGCADHRPAPASQEKASLAVAQATTPVSTSPCPPLGQAWRELSAGDLVC